MSHELNMNKGKASMMYIGQVPWHGLGTRLDHPATAKEAMTAAQLDYAVEKKEIYLEDHTRVARLWATVRMDTNVPLGVVGDGYRLIQNQEAFGFMDSLAADGRIEYHTAGALGAGERVWMLAKLPGVIRVKGTEDITEKYLCLANSHDGASALKVWWTPVRVVCANTLRAASRGAHKGVSIRHSGDIKVKVKEAQRVLGLAVKYYDDLEGQINRLAGITLDAKQLTAYVEEVLPSSKEEVSTRTKNMRQAVESACRSSENRLKGISGTLWAAYNGFTQWVDHDMSPHSRRFDQATTRLNSIWFGNGSRVKQRAWDRALELATALKA